MVPSRAFEKTAIMRWKLGEVSHIGETAALESPVFQRFQRKWRMVFKHSTIRFIYIQGLEKIAVVLRQVLEQFITNLLQDKLKRIEAHDSPHIIRYSLRK